MLKQLSGTVFFLSIAFMAMAQKADTLLKNKADTVTAKPDTVVPRSFAPKVKKERTYNPDSTHLPSKAVKRSLILPGWGQVYNRKIWKVPLIYGGLGLLGAAIIFNQRYYTEFLALARIKKTGTVPTSPKDKLYDAYQKYKDDYELYKGQSTDFFSNASYGYQRNRDLSILGVLGVWGIQAIDAYIDAKFINSFTVDNDLSMRITPGLIGQPMYAANFSDAYIPGIKITFTLK